MPTPEHRLEALESQVAALKSRDAANGALLRMIATACSTLNWLRVH
jgi:hypothetical protein